jgi:pimeloyl-ACP methyl ester carboxylesterase
MPKSFRSVWGRVRRIWITTGISATVLFVAWCAIAYRASATAQAALQGNASVRVSAGPHDWVFQPKDGGAGVGVVFFPGALVDPVAYAPLLLAVAEEGYPAILVQVPRRGVMGGAEGAEPLNRAVAATLQVHGVQRWVVAGHSRGAEIAARLVATRAPSIAGLVLIGSSHPRDFSLAGIPLPVTRIYGTRDTVADWEKQQATMRNLPASTRLVRIDGGNHSQFGSYGFQPADWPATISREEQQRQTVAAIVDMLRILAAGVVQWRTSCASHPAAAPA